MTKKLCMILWLSLLALQTQSNPFESQLYDDLISWYNTDVRPVENASDIINVKFGASLIRVIELDEKKQILTTNLWLEMGWQDTNLQWDPAIYGNLTKMHIPAYYIWVPDIVLYNNAMGNPQITIMADALVSYDGTVCWRPPAIYNSFCSIDIAYFPYDEQICEMQFGGWTYTGVFLNMEQVVVDHSEKISECPDDDETCKGYLWTGMDLSNFQPSAEWDLMFLESRRYEVIYPGCCGSDVYVDIRFKLSLRRKPLFYTVNLVIPCMLIALLTTFVFYIPSRDHKLTYAISILVTLIFFYLVLIDLIPPTSLVIPMIGKYLLFTIMLVFVATIVSIITLNVFRRSGATHRMPDWVRWLFLEKLPGPLCLDPRFTDDDIDDDSTDYYSAKSSLRSEDLAGGGVKWNPGTSMDSDNSKLQTHPLLATRRLSPCFMSVDQYANRQLRLSQLAELRGMHPDLIRRMADNVSYIAEHYRALQAEDQTSEDWSYVAEVLDRLFLIIFSVVNLIGTALIILQAPSLYDTRDALMPSEAMKPLGGECVFK